MSVKDQWSSWTKSPTTFDFDIEPTSDIVHVSFREEYRYPIPFLSLSALLLTVVSYAFIFPLPFTPHAASFLTMAVSMFVILSLSIDLVERSRAPREHSLEFAMPLGESDSLTNVEKNKRLELMSNTYRSDIIEVLATIKSAVEDESACLDEKRAVRRTGEEALRTLFHTTTLDSAPAAIEHCSSAHEDKMNALIFRAEANKEVKELGMVENHTISQFFTSP